MFIERKHDIVNSWFHGTNTQVHNVDTLLLLFIPFRALYLIPFNGIRRQKNVLQIFYFRKGFMFICFLCPRIRATFST